MIDMTTASIETRAALALVNLALCSGIGWACVCRFAAMSSETTCCHYRAVYVLLFVAASASGFAPILFREWPGPGQIVLAVASLGYLAVSSKRWRGGPPDYARKLFAPGVIAEAGRRALAERNVEADRRIADMVRQLRK